MLEACLLQVGRHRFENVHTAGDVQLDLLGHLARDIQVAENDRFLRASPKGKNRHGAVPEQRNDRGRREQKRESGGNPGH